VLLHDVEGGHVAKLEDKVETIFVAKDFQQVDQVDVLQPLKTVLKSVSSNPRRAWMLTSVEPGHDLGSKRAALCTYGFYIVKSERPPSQPKTIRIRGINLNYMCA
jgi:hypothetical protein